MPGRLYPKSYEGQAPQEFGIGANILKTRTFNLTVARDLEEVEIGGSCLWAIAATSLNASIDIYVNDRLRDPVTFQQGMFIRGIPFSRLFVSHAAQPAETITLFFAVEQEVKNIEIVNPSIGFTDVNVGTVANDTSSWYHTNRKEAFIGSFSGGPGGLGHCTMGQLWNPAASGKNLLCQAIQVNNADVTGQAMYLAHHNAALNVAGIWGNKYLAEPIGVGEIWGACLAPAGTQMTTFYHRQNTPYDYPFLSPIQVILIPEGFGLIVQTRIVEVFCATVFQWVEIDV